LPPASLVRVLWWYSLRAAMFQKVGLKMMLAAETGGIVLVDQSIGGR
jgi:hypothetical protein